MSSSIASKNNKSDNIDFSFFESEDCLTKLYSKHYQSDSSKITTKAVIEQEPDLLEFPKNTIHKQAERFDRPTEKRPSQYRKQSDCLSSPSSSLERKLLTLDNSTIDSLMNCLAYNDNERFDHRVASSPYSFDLKESSDNSLSDSTVTTITSDFTCISSLCSSSLSSSSCDSISDDQDENTAVGESNPESERPTDFGFLQDDLKQVPSNTNNEKLGELKENYELNSSKSESCDDSDQKLESQDENSNSLEAYESDFESYNETRYLEKNCESGETVLKSCEEIDNLSDNESHVTTLEDGLGDISITQSRSSSVKTSYKKRKNCNLTFSREELIRIERDNLILLKKIMAYSKHKPVSLNQQPINNKKTSTAINRAKLQKKIEQDNYILYSKISAMSRLKKVF